MINIVGGGLKLWHWFLLWFTVKIIELSAVETIAFLFAAVELPVLILWTVAGWKAVKKNKGWFNVLSLFWSGLWLFLWLAFFTRGLYLGYVQGGM